MFCVWLWIIIYTEYTQKNGAVSKVNKKCIFFTLHGHNVHRQQQQLSKFLMCYQQFASHAYCGAAVPFSKMASQQENSVFSVLRCPDVWLRCSVNFVHGLEKTQPHAQIQHQRDSPKSQHFLCVVPRESARPIFLHWSNCDWRLISRHVGKLVVTPTEHQLWRLHSTTGRYSPPFS